MSSNKQGGGRKGRRKGGKGKGQETGGPKQAKPAQKQQKQQQKEKVSAGSSRKRRSTTKGQTTKVDLAQARLDLIIRSKFQNPAKDTPTPLESKICQLLVDLEASSKDLKPHLRDLGIVSARKIPVTATKKAIVIFVPNLQHARWQKLQDRLVRELEKKFNDEDVIFIAQRKVMKLCQINPKTNAPRPRTQTITAVQKAILDDVVYPTKIVGKRTRFRVGGRRLLKVYLDPKDSKDIETRIPTFEAVYRKLTKKNVSFLFPRYVI
eukprot:CAMPEP_0197052848 /NCGR_PEP_ID=MMETSP1384-20130603/27252_1 /TAXON_ID=29189 /ORGANISM="Ammonia sp." /LENGTH=264 /DNA_ID=CAMNT_0042485659 /DNA_START=32 /DNA_END=826 /DNA_ORIENTATION=+